MSSHLIKKIIAFTQNRKQNRKSNLILIKLAGIGDVAMTCNALNNTLGEPTRPIHIHWIIDKSLALLARTLLADRQNVKYSFHLIDTFKLFNASRLDQANESLKIAKAVAKIQPGVAILLHRDWRYTAMIRPFFTGSIVRVTREPIHEVDAYKISINRALNKIGIALENKKTKSNKQGVVEKAVKKAVKKTGKHKLKLGFLIGGARGTRINYQEKRWPYFGGLISKLYNETKHELYFYGSSVDNTSLQIMLAEHSIPGDAGPRLHNLTGLLELDSLPESLSRLDRFVAIDSGLAHIAALSMKRKDQKIISLYGPTNPKIWSPIGEHPDTVIVVTKSAPCSPCYRDDGNFSPCKYSGEQFQYCMKLISPDEIYNLIT